MNYMFLPELGLSNVETDLLALIITRRLEPRIFRMLHPIPVSSFKRSQLHGSCLIPMSVKISCPHCGIKNAMSFIPTAFDGNQEIFTGQLECSSCGEKAKLILLEPEFKDLQTGSRYEDWRQAWITPPPKDESSMMPEDVEESYRKDFHEATLTRSISPRASAALSRYTLQRLLEEKGGAKSGRLDQAIDEVIQNKSLPSHLADNLHAVRHVGNFAAHPNKDKATEEIIEIDDDEAEWLLETLKGLLDFYFIQPAKTQKMKDKFNEKMKAAGKTVSIP